MSGDYSNKNVSILNVGNVLVDIEITISEDELSKLPIKKSGAIEIDAIQLSAYLDVYRDQITNRYLGGSYLQLRLHHLFLRLITLFLVLLEKIVILNS